MRTFLTLTALAVMASPLAGRAEDEKKEEPQEIKVQLTDADKAALAKVREFGGSTLPVAQNDERIEIGYHLATDKKIGNGQLEPLKGRTFIRSLNVRGTGVDDNGLALLADCTGLERLHLEKTKVTDAGLPHLKKLQKLQYLNLYGTAVTDGGLDSIIALKGLKKVFIWQSKITIEGVAKLKKARPDLTITPDLVEDKIRAEKEAVRKAEEAKKKAEEEAKKKAEEAKKKAEEEAKKKAEAEKKKAEEEAKKKAEAEKKKADEAKKADAEKKKE